MRMCDVKVNDIPKKINWQSHWSETFYCYAGKRGNPGDPIAPTWGHFVFYLQETNHGGVQYVYTIQCHRSRSRMGSTWYFFLGSRICALDNWWVVEGETWIIKGAICGRDAYKSLQVSSGMRGRKFGDFFNFSHYCVQCWGSRLNPDETHRPHWYCSKVGDWIGSGTLYIVVHNSEGTSESAPYLFETPFLNEWPAVVIQATVALNFWWNFACWNQVRAWQ